MSAAQKSLRDEGKHISHISNSVGYEDISYFRRLFKRHVGLSPSDYRQKYRLAKSKDI
jgi:YesN/AraC family two-component response regulator